MMSNNISSLKILVEHLRKDKMLDVISKNNGEVYRLVCEHSNFDIIHYLTEYFTKEVIKNH